MTDSDTKKRALFRWTEVALGALAVLLALRLVSLQRQASASSKELTALRERVATLQADVIGKGRDADHLWRIVGSSRLARSIKLRGTVARVGSELKWDLSALTVPHLFFTLDKNCALCSAALPIMRDLAANHPCGLTVVGITLNDDVPLAWSPDSTGFPIVTRASGEAWDVLPLATPAAAVLVGPGGRVARWWVGPTTDDDLAVIQRTVANICDD